ncbi:MAG: hypothetical protein IH830_14340, partial [Planctomycetes bacterium]|nr:hypothetical protein [Planctomycetota bacterium]
MSVPSSQDKGTVQEAEVRSSLGKETDARPLREKEILKLPPWAMTALAARCAMRVQPLVGTESFRESTREEIAWHIETLDIAVTIAAVPSATATAAHHAAHAAAAATT